MAGLRRLLDTHPDAALPFKAALAATIAWLIVQPASGFIDEYQYYAPLGAVITMSPVLSRAVRSAIQAVLAIVAGGMLAIVVQALPLPQPFAIAVTVGVGLACSVSQRFGSMGSWVPFVALFALLLHEQHPWHYVGAYALLAALGALVGLLVDFLLPQHPTGPAARAERRLSDGLAQALEALAGAISVPPQGGGARPYPSSSALAERSQHLRSAVQQIQDSQRGNWRSRAAAPSTAHIDDRARSLERLATGVAHALDIAVPRGCSPATEDAGVEVGLPDDLRTGLVEALNLAAGSLRSCVRGDSSTWSSHDRAALVRLWQAFTDEQVPLDDKTLLWLMVVAAELDFIARGGGAP